MAQAQILKLIVHNRQPAYRVILQCLDDLLEVTRSSGVDNIDTQRLEMINYWYYSGYLSQDECEALLDFIGMDWSVE